MSLSDRAVLPSSRLAARFGVVETYAGGEGWSGAVVERGETARMVLKILDPGNEVAEASLLASLRHPSIPGILETGHTEDGRAYLLREHVIGRPLQEEFPLSPAEAKDLAVELLEILAYVHLRSILHLDLKP